MTEGIDYILHQAALGSVPRSIKDPSTSNSVNVEGTLNIFIVGKENHVKRIIYASSSSVYGDNLDLPKIEEKSGYPYLLRRHKKQMSFMPKFLLNNIIWKSLGLGIINVFGQRQNPNGAYAAVIPKWIQGMIKGEDIFIFGDATSSRLYIYSKCRRTEYFVSANSKK